MKDEKDFHIEALTAKIEELRNALACEMDDTSNACAALNNEIERLRRELAGARGLLRTYGGHVPPCVGRPCECGFKDAWDSTTVQPDAVHGKSAAVDVTRLYHELIYAVASKYPGESRHDTALRYIRDRETLPLQAECPADSADVALCAICNGTGAVDAPTSEADPVCSACDGEGK